MVFCTEFLDGCGLEGHCVGLVYGVDGAVRAALLTWKTCVCVVLCKTVWFNIAHE